MTLILGSLWGGGGGGGLLPYMSYIGMCRCEGYGFQRVYSRIGYRNQRVVVSMKLISCLKNLV